MTTCKEVFQLAQEKGYKLFHKTAFLWTKEGEEYLIRDIEPLLELTLIQKWLRDEHGIDIELFNQYTNAKEGKWYAPTIFYHSKKIGDGGRNTFPTVQQCSYERALTEGINEALKLL